MCNKNFKKKKRKKSLLYKVVITKIKNDYKKATFQKEKSSINNKSFSIINSDLYIILGKLIHIIFVISINLFINFFECSQRTILIKLSEISLKVKGQSSSVRILSDSFFENYKQFQVYIDGKVQSKSTAVYALNNEINDIKIIFNNPISTANKMFYQGENIIEINLTKFDTSQVTNMNSMFSSCSSLISLDLSNFNTSQVINMNSMFSNCSSLISLNISNFDTSQVIDMGSMFKRCSSLKSLNLSRFNISTVNNMSLMCGESLLNYLDLSNFNMSKINYISRMFYGSNLEYVNFKIAKINANENQISNDLFVSNSLNSIIACENDNDVLLRFFKKKKFIYCNNNYTYHKIKYFGYMKNSTKYNEYTCDICGTNFYNKYRIINGINNSYIDCFELIDDYYLDENDWNYKSCYYTCKSLIIIVYHVKIIY